MEVTDTKIRCHRGLGIRIGLGIFGAVFGLMCLFVLVFAWPSSSASLAQRAPVDILSRAGLFLFIPIVGIFCPTLVFLYYAGPADLIIDISERTYQMRRGFPLLASWTRGSLDDIAGLRVKTAQTSSSTSYQLLLDWRNTQAATWTLGDGPVSGRRPFQMAFSRDAGQLREEAQHLSERLHVPILDARPRWEQVRRRGMRGLLLGLIILLYAMLFLPSLLLKRSLAAQGQETSAVVTSLWQTKSYHVRYEYQVGGQKFDGSSSTTWSVYSSLHVGSRVAIRYLPAYPHTSAVIDERSP